MSNVPLKDLKYFFLKSYKLGWYMYAQLIFSILTTQAKETLTQDDQLQVCYTLLYIPSMEVVRGKMAV